MCGFLVKRVSREVVVRSHLDDRVLLRVFGFFSALLDPLWCRDSPWLTNVCDFPESFSLSVLRGVHVNFCSSRLLTNL